MTSRYAIYYAPTGDEDLWAAACAWLGRDALTGQSVERPALQALDGLDLEGLTRDPAGYGFHATLKAPFELARGRSEKELLQFAEQFASQRQGFTGAMAVAQLGSFVAFRLTRGHELMAELHAACVRWFEPFRAPLSASDLLRRQKAPLSPRQEERLSRWGYPHLFEDFRFHMTLTGSIRDEATRARVTEALGSHFAAVAGARQFETVAVFKQDDRRGPFHILGQFTLQPALASA